MHKCQKGTWVIYSVQCAGVNRGVEWQDKQGEEVVEEVRWSKRRMIRVPSFFYGVGWGYGTVWGVYSNCTDKFVPKNVFQPLFEGTTTNHARIARSGPLTIITLAGGG
jgi:hypothetical protein